MKLPKVNEPEEESLRLLANNENRGYIRHIPKRINIPIVTEFQKASLNFLAFDKTILYTPLVNKFSVPSSV